MVQDLPLQEVQVEVVAELPEVQILLVDLEILEELEQLTLEEAVAVVHGRQRRHGSRWRRGTGRLLP